MSRKLTLILSTLLLLSIVFAACGKKDGELVGVDASAPAAASEPEQSADTEKASEIVEITEKLFIAQTNDIYLNPKNYLGKTVKYEGLFMDYYWEQNDTTYYYVIRYGPSCCVYDENAGFEVLWEDEDGTYPQNNDWVEVVGVLEQYEEDGTNDLRVRLTSLTVLDERGKETVTT